MAVRQHYSRRGYETPGHEKDHILQTGSQTDEQMIISGEPLLYRSTGASFVEHRFFVLTMDRFCNIINIEL